MTTMLDGFSVIVLRTHCEASMAKAEIAMLAADYRSKHIDEADIAAHERNDDCREDAHCEMVQMQVAIDELDPDYFVEPDWETEAELSYEAMLIEHFEPSWVRYEH